ncbi:hypothetical protein EMPS_10237 [Entomortierella parvispora]|uniref:BRCT domain-containing protein n=1 Tax=Entomortierella parvispora TaxID=205924 RepID=A0A9P3HJX2_9FUNG|nr:hypothetical protein EMPS_10237 [Entomortierella parvispora]
MTDPPPMRKSASKSPPILPAHLTPPRPPPTSSTPPPPAASTSQQHARNVSTSDIGVLKLSGQVSQNDERLPPRTTGQASLGSGSESGSSGPQDPNISQLPFLDISPPAPADTSFSLDPTAHTQQTREVTERRQTYSYVADSQSVDALSFPDMSTHPGQAVLAETSFSHHSDVSINNSSDHSTLSIHSGSSGSHRTQSSSQAGHSSGSLNSRSSGSQAESQPESTISDISFTNVETSTPRQTPNRPTSQISTPSDGDHHLLSSPLSPTGRYSTSQQSPDYAGRGSSAGAGGSMDHFVRSAIGLPGPSPPRPIQVVGRKVTTILEDKAEEGDGEDEDDEEEEVSSGQVASDEMPTQILEPFDPDLQEVLAEEDGSSTHPVQLADDEEDEEDIDELNLVALAELNSQDVHGSAGLTPPVSRLLQTKTTTTTQTTRTTSSVVTSAAPSSRATLLVTGKQDQGKEGEVEEHLGLNDYYTSDEDDDTNRSNTTTGGGIDLHISQSQADIGDILPLSRHSSTVMGQPLASSSSTGSTSSAATAATGASKSSAQTTASKGSAESHKDQVVAHDGHDSRARTPTPPSHVGSSTSLSDSPTERTKRTMRGSRRSSGSHGSQELASSQNSAHSSTSAPSSFTQRLARAQQEGDNPSDDELEGPLHPIINKRRRIGAAAATITRVPSSVEDEAEKQFWMGSGTEEPETSGKERKERGRRQENDSDDERRHQRGSRSRSASLDISSFPDEGLSELDIGPYTDSSQQEESSQPTGGKEGDATAGESARHGPSPPPQTTPTSSPTRKSRRRVGSPPPEPPRVSPKRAPARQFRSRSTSATNLRGASSSQTPTTAPARVSLRRMQSIVDASRVYKTDDSVWARWRKAFYAGRVVRKNNQLYDIRFLDDDVASCENTQMRPFMLKLGTSVMAKKTESMDYEAAVEGIQLSSVLEQSRVDVRFGDNTEANLALNQICLTTEMMAELDKEMNWDSDSSSSKGAAASKRASASQTRREASFVEPLSGPSYSQASELFSSQQAGARADSLIPTTPTKGKGGRFAAAQKSFAAPSTPTRRSKGSGQSLGLGTPVRRAKVLLDLFKDMKFVLSLTGPGGSRDLERETSAKIKAGGGTIIEDYKTLMYPNQDVNLTNVVLISFTTLRTAKYISALALNIPRLSYRWIDACSEARQLLPHHSYHLPTGFSNELETIVSSIPYMPTGLFDGLIIGLCGGLSIRNEWERNLYAAGAKKVKVVNAKTGPMNCNYIVFFNTKAYRAFIESNNSVPSLCDEWLIQCLINQRIVSIHGHKSYTDLAKKDNPNQQQPQQQQSHHAANTSSASGGHSS